MKFTNENYTVRVIQANDYIHANDLTRLEKYHIMKDAIIGSELYKISGSKKRNQMDMKFLKLLL